MNVSKEWINSNNELFNHEYWELIFHLEDYDSEFTNWLLMFMQKEQEEAARRSGAYLTREADELLDKAAEWVVKNSELTTRKKGFLEDVKKGFELVFPQKRNKGKNLQ